MKKYFLITFFVIGFLVAKQPVAAQCSICTKTAQQLGEKPAKGMNAGIIYLAFAPLLLIGFIGFRWWRQHKDTV